VGCRPPDTRVFERQLREADSLIFFGKFTANFFENAAERVSFTVPWWTICHVSAQCFIDFGALCLLQCFGERSRICQSLFQAIYTPCGLAIKLCKSLLVESFAVRQLQSRSEAFGFVMKSLMIIEENPRRFECLPTLYPIIGPADYFGGEPQNSLINQVNTPPLRVIEVKGQIKRQTVRRRHSGAVRVRNR